MATYRELPSNFALGTEARRARDRVVDDELNVLACAALAQLDADSERQKSYEAVVDDELNVLACAALAQLDADSERQKRYEEVVAERDEAVRKYDALRLRVINAPRSVVVGPISSSSDTLTVIGTVYFTGTYGLVCLERDEILRKGTDDE